MFKPPMSVAVFRGWRCSRRTLHCFPRSASPLPSPSPSSPTSSMRRSSTSTTRHAAPSARLDSLRRCLLTMEALRVQSWRMSSDSVFGHKR
eukprot:538307-Pleurochrysis_carterae.AAC.1